MVMKMNSKRGPRRVSHRVSSGSDGVEAGETALMLLVLDLAANGVFGNVFEEMLRPEVHRVAPIWKVSMPKCDDRSLTFD